MTFVAELVIGDVNDKAYQKTVIDHLVSQVFVGDDQYLQIYACSALLPNHRAKRT